MVPRRHRIPTPAWAELPADASAGDTFRPFVTGAFVARTAEAFDGMPPGAPRDIQPSVRDDDSDAPKASPF